MNAMNYTEQIMYIYKIIQKHWENLYIEKGYIDFPKVFCICYGSYLHGWWTIPPWYVQILLDTQEISSKQIGAYALLYGRRWTRTHFGRLRFIGAQIWSDVSWFLCQWAKVCLDRHSRASRDCPPKLWPSLKGLSLSPGTFLGECRLGLRYFWRSRACLGYNPTPDPPKNALCYTRPVSGTCDKYRYPPGCLRVSERHSKLLYNTCIQYICSVIVIYLFPPISLVCVFSFWPHNSISRFFKTSIVDWESLISSLTALMMVY